MTLRWRNMTDEEREREYSPSSCLADGDYRPFVEAYRQRSDRAWSRLHETSGRTATIRFGDSPSQTIDVAVPLSTDQAPPMLVYFHGGYWQELSKADSRFAAWDCVQRGWAFAAVDYTLAPLATVPEIVEECRRALHTLHREAAPLGFDATRIFVAGSSAGAQLAAMAATDPGVPADPVRGAVLVSGIYDLEPLIGTSIDDALGLDLAAASENSPLRLATAGFPPTVIAYGADETSEFKAQSEAFARKLRDTGATASAFEVPGRNHFDVVLDLAAPNTVLGDATTELIEQHGSRHADL